MTKLFSLFKIMPAVLFFSVLLALLVQAPSQASTQESTWVPENQAQRESAIDAAFEALSASEKSAYHKFSQPGGVYDLLRGSENEVGYKLAAMAYLIPDSKVSSMAARKVARWLGSNNLNELWETKDVRQGMSGHFAYATNEVGQKPVGSSALRKATFLSLMELLKGVASLRKQGVNENVLVDTAQFTKWMTENEFDIALIDDAEVEALWKVVPGESGEATFKRLGEGVVALNPEIRNIPFGPVRGPVPGNDPNDLDRVLSTEIGKLQSEFVNGLITQLKGIPFGAWALLIRLKDIEPPFLYQNTAVDIFLRGWFDVGGYSQFEYASLFMMDANVSIEQKRAFSKRILFWLKVLALEYNRKLPRDPSFNDLRIDVSSLANGVEMIRLWAALIELHRSPIDPKTLFDDPTIDREVARYAGAIARHYGAYEGVNYFLARELFNEGIQPQDLARFEAENILGLWQANDMSLFNALVQLQTQDADLRRRASGYFDALVQSNRFRIPWLDGTLDSTEYTLAQMTEYLKDPNARALVLLAFVRAIKVGKPNFKGKTLKTRHDLRRALGDLASLVTVTKDDVSSLKHFLPAGPLRELAPELKPAIQLDDKATIFREQLQMMFLTSPVPGVQAPENWATNKFLDDEEVIRLTRLYALYLNRHLDALGAPKDRRVRIDLLHTQTEINYLGSLDHSVRSGRWQPKVSCDAIFN